MHEPLKQDGLSDEDLTRLLATLRAPEEVSTNGPRPGFYGRVMDRVETQRKSSIWSVFLEPVFSLRLAAASLTLAILMGVALFTTGSGEAEEQFAYEPSVVVMDETRAAPALGVSAATIQTSADALHAAPVSTMGTEQGREVVLVDLVSYQEH
jgi:hypothetical protein